MIYVIKIIICQSLLMSRTHNNKHTQNIFFYIISQKKLNILEKLHQYFTNNKKNFPGPKNWATAIQNRTRPQVVDNIQIIPGYRKNLQIWKPNPL